MPPKGAFYPPHKLGSVLEHKGGYRLQLAAMPELGALHTTYGPTRATRAKANKDLAEARRCASRKDMLEFVRALLGMNASAAGGCLHPVGELRSQSGTASPGAPEDIEAAQPWTQPTASRSRPPASGAAQPPAKRLRVKTPAANHPRTLPCAPSFRAQEFGEGKSATGANMGSNSSLTIQCEKLASKRDESASSDAHHEMTTARDAAAKNQQQLEKQGEQKQQQDKRMPAALARADTVQDLQMQLRDALTKQDYSGAAAIQKKIHQAAMEKRANQKQQQVEAHKMDLEQLLLQQDYAGAATLQKKCRQRQRLHMRRHSRTCNCNCTVHWPSRTILEQLRFKRR